MLKITKKMTGKMQGMQSLNTSSLNNKACIKRSKIKNSVCYNCYSNHLLLMYKNADKAFRENHKILTSFIIPKELLPKINAGYFRFDAYGELDSNSVNGMNQLINYMNLAKINPHCTFTLWTKEKGLITKYLRDFKKPKNVIFIYSSLMVNKREKLPIGFDKVFTVYDKGHKGKSFINCGDKKCIDCLTCYNTKDRKIYINEVLK